MNINNDTSCDRSQQNMSTLYENGLLLQALSNTAEYIKQFARTGKNTKTLYFQVLAQYETLADYVSHNLTPGDLRMIENLRDLTSSTGEYKLWGLLYREGKHGVTRRYRDAYEQMIREKAPYFGIIQVS